MVVVDVVRTEGCFVRGDEGREDEEDVEEDLEREEIDMRFGLRVCRDCIDGVMYHLFFAASGDLDSFFGLVTLSVEACTGTRAYW